MKKVKIDDLANICPDCKFKIAECGGYTTLVKSELKYAEKDGYFTANSNIRFCLSAIDFGEYVFVDDEDYEKYFK